MARNIRKKNGLIVWMGNVVYTVWRLLKTLFVLAVIAGVVYTMAHERKIECEICGAEVKEWTDIELIHNFSSGFITAKAVVMGDYVPSERIVVCQGCKARIDIMWSYIDTPEFEAVYQRRARK